MYNQVGRGFVLELPCTDNFDSLFHLLGGGGLFLPLLLSRNTSSFGIHHRIPPSERARVVSEELFVVDIVVIGTGPKGEEVMQAPGKFVPGVSIDGLEQAPDDPQVHCQDMEIFGEAAEDDRDTDSTEGEDHGLDRRSVFSSKAERRAVLMVQLVNHFVQARCVKQSVKPIMPCVFEDKEQSDLPCHLGPMRERNGCRQAEVLSHRMEEPDLREFDGEVGEEDKFRACPLFGKGRHFLTLDLVLAEVRDFVHDHERQAAAKIDHLMHDK